MKRCFVFRENTGFIFIFRSDLNSITYSQNYFLIKGLFKNNFYRYFWMSNKQYYLCKKTHVPEIFLAVQAFFFIVID